MMKIDNNYNICNTIWKYFGVVRKVIKLNDITIYRNNILLSISFDRKTQPDIKTTEQNKIMLRLVIANGGEVTNYFIPPQPQEPDINRIF